MEEGVVVDRQGHPGVGPPSKDDEADPISVELLDEVDDLSLRPGEAAGIDILRVHRAREVHGDDDLDAAALEVPPGEAPARLDSGEDTGRHTDQHQGDGPCAPSLQTRRDDDLDAVTEESAEIAATATGSPEGQQHQHWQRPAEVEELSSRAAHGILRNNVASNSTLSASSKRPDSSA